MKHFLRLCGLLVVLVCLPFAQAQTSLQISKIEIKHVGPPASSDELIRSNIRVKVGDTYLRTAVDDDVRNLYLTGQFYNIQVRDDITAGGVVLTYIVQGKPRLLEIKFTGNQKLADAKLKKKLTSKIGEPLDEQKLFTDCQEIEKLYQKTGYPGTRVTYVPSIDESSGHGSATITIVESPKMKITDIQFSGAQAFPEKKLRGELKTRRHWMFSWLTGSGVFKEDDFDEDKDRLAQFYHERGYIDFEIKDVEFLHPTPQTMVIRFNVFEGSQYKVGAIKFTGIKLFTPADIAAANRAAHPSSALKKVKLGPNGLEMDIGDTFTPDGLTKDTDAIKNFYGSKGFIDVTPGSRNLIVKKIPNTESGTMDLEFIIDEGQKSYVEKIEIRGNVKTKDRVIRRELSVAPGDVFDMVRINNSKVRLEGVDYFSKVDTRPESTDVPNRKNLVVGVEEKPTGNMTLGAGFSSVDSLVGFAEVYQGNFDLFHPPTFTGGGQKFRLRVQLGTQRKDFETEFIEPWFLERKLNLSVNLYYRELDYLSPNNLYRETLAGMRLGMRRALGSDFLIGGVGYTIQQVGIDFFNNIVASPATPAGLPPSPPDGYTRIPQTLLDEAGNSMISKFDASLTWDTRGPGFLPDKGQQTSLTVELAGPFGGEKDFYRLELKTHWYFKGLAAGHVLEILGGTGVADSYGSTKQVPFYQRWYLGGLNSLRGFQFDDISPREISSGSTEPIGGNTYWFGSIEYSLPIVERLRFAVFYDIGNVMSGAYSYDFSHYSDNWGFGLRLNLPLGGASGTPLRLDYGIPISHDAYNNGRGRFQFSVGFDRPF
ncbi:MAG: outer membrane protein assembly factor BamA [Verrucomicrobiota bacterium]